MRILATRLKPDQDLKQSLQEFSDRNQVQAGFILTAVGSLRQAHLRFAGQDEGKRFTEKFEIVSLVGTLSPTGLHLHISLADKQGKTIGGHLLNGCIIYTTAEIIVGDSPSHTFLRTFDEQTGFNELEIKSKTTN